MTQKCEICELDEPNVTVPFRSHWFHIGCLKNCVKGKGSALYDNDGQGIAPWYVNIRVGDRRIPLTKPFPTRPECSQEFATIEAAIDRF